MQESDMMGFGDDQYDVPEHGDKTELTDAEKKYAKDIYSQLDRDESGSLSFTEFRRGLQLLGMNPTNYEVKCIMKEYDEQGGKWKITYEEFEKVVLREILKNTKNEFDILEAFKLFDKNKDGTLDKDELGKFLMTMGGEPMSDDEVKFLFDQLYSYRYEQRWEIECYGGSSASIVMNYRIVRVSTIHALKPLKCE